MGILECGGGFEERDAVLFEVRGGLVGVPFVVAKDYRSHTERMCQNTWLVKGTAIIDPRPPWDARAVRGDDPHKIKQRCGATGARGWPFAATRPAACY